MKKQQILLVLSFIISTTFASNNFASKFGEGLGVGALTGFGSGMLISKLTERQAPQGPVYVVPEQAYAEPAIVHHHPRPVIKQHYKHKPNNNYNKQKQQNKKQIKSQEKQAYQDRKFRERQLELEEKKIELELLKEKNRKKELAIQEMKLEIELLRLRKTAR